MGVAGHPARNAGEYKDGQQQEYQPWNDGQNQPGDADERQNHEQHSAETLVQKGHGAVNAGVVHGKSP